MLKYRRQYGVLWLWGGDNKAGISRRRHEARSQAREAAIKSVPTLPETSGKFDNAPKVSQVLFPRIVILTRYIGHP